MEKKLLGILFYISGASFLIALISLLFVSFGIEPLYGSKPTYEQVIAFALISVAATGILNFLTDSERRIEKQNKKQEKRY